jgi:hypothetical protein
MATKSEEFFHDKWLGHVQTESDGLVVAKPVLLAANCAQRQSPQTQDKLRELCPHGPEEQPRRIADLLQLFIQLLDFDTDLFDSAIQISNEVSLYAPEGPQTLRPTFGLLRQDEPVRREGAGSPASNAAEKYVALIWDVTDINGETNEDAIGLTLDKPETITGEWAYPAAAKFDRLLRHCQVPVGILTNREVIRLVYAPHGESSGYITFRIDDMATVGGRPILDAMIMLLCANQWFGVSDDNSLPSLLRRSREYQGTVTEDLAEQVFSGLELLLKGFQTAAERDQSELLRSALERDEDHLYRGLLTVMLRMVFILYAEDRSLLPVEHPLYAKRMSLLGLFEKLQRDNGNFPDSMSNRFGAWGHIISLSRTIYLGVDHGDFHIPPRQGDLFDPHRYSFLEGWTGDSSPVITQTARSEVKVPTVDDGTVFALLQSLLIFQGQRLSYRTLDVEQIGSVYEALMGYQVYQCEFPSVAIKLNSKKGTAKYWLETSAVLALPAAQRVKWLQGECGFDKAVATKINKVLGEAEKTLSENPNAVIESLLALAAGKKENKYNQLASVGQYILQPGTERRRSGSHYTPRSLTAPIVSKTLQPLLRCLGEAPSADQILELKVCDPAMGSGAFLVECCRQLADEVVVAWGRSHEIEKIAANCPEGDVVAHARRLVAQCCLYGVDKNIMAVQLAKLSLWLFTLARELPFTFLDHSLRYGDSLVGFNFEQIKAFHWKPTQQLTFLEDEIKRALDEVVSIRQEIHQLAKDSTPEGQLLKAQRLFDANDSTEKVRKIADVCVGAFFAEEKNNLRLIERQVREDIIRGWLDGDEDACISVNNWVKDIRRQHAPFHWWLEFPEVFYDERPDPLLNGIKNGSAYMDVIIGNPPFIRGSSISILFGKSYLDWLLQIHEGSHGNGDISAHFIRRSSSLLGDHGAAGLIATNTIAQGDTRVSGLKHLLSQKWRIYDATRSMSWPGSAAVTVSVVHIISESLGGQVLNRLNGQVVPQINSRLRSKHERVDPVRLASNLGRAYKGVTPYGSGFELSPDEQKVLVDKNPLNSQRIYPYLGGAEVNSSPTQYFSRFIISFEGMSLEDAEKWPELLDILREKVKPERDKNRRDARKKNWWRFGEPTPALSTALESLDNCLVIPQQFPNCVRVALQPADRIFSQKLIVLPNAGFADFAVLQSRIHDAWVQLNCGRMGAANTPVYSVNDCFQTFAFPDSSSHAKTIFLESVGENFYGVRAKFMLDTDQGLTKTYNALRDPECDNKHILELRCLHEDLDHAVLKLYGWTDLEVPAYCPMNSEDETMLEAFNDEIIDRLYVLNAKRIAEEKRQEEDNEPIKISKAKRSVSKALDPPLNATLNLFNKSDD